MKPDPDAFRLTGFSENLLRSVNPIPCESYLPWKGHTCSDPLCSAELDQEEIDQRDQGRAHAGGDQGVVGADVGLRIER